MLVFDEVIEGGEAIETTKARLFETALLGTVVDLCPIVYPYRADLEGLGGTQRAVDVTGPDARGVPLFIRTKRSVKLTAAGTAFLNEARLTLAQARRAIASARQAARAGESTLVLGFGPAAEIKPFPEHPDLAACQLPHAAS